MTWPPVPDPSSFAAYVLFFATLVAFKLAFGVALHWLGAHMLETLHGVEHGGSASTSRVASPKKRSETVGETGGHARGGPTGTESTGRARRLFNASKDGRASLDKDGKEGGTDLTDVADVTRRKSGD